MKPDDDNQAESRRIIGRVGAESEPTMARRVQDHMNARDADENDPVEVWGTRIGRWLGLALLIYLLWWLFDFALWSGRT